MDKDRLAAGLLCLILVTGCGGVGHKPIEPVPVDISIERLDRTIFRADTSADIRASGTVEHGGFFQVYVEDILQGVSVEDPRLRLMLGQFRNDPDWSAAQRSVDSVLGSLDREREQFEEAFGRLRALFPDSLVPRVVAFNSGYNYGIFPTDSVLGVGLEWFIGPEDPVIGYLAADAFPHYVKQRMRPEMLVPSAVKGWLLVHYTRDMAGMDLLANLVETGKVMVLLDALLPGTDPALKLAFSREQLDWCETNEYAIWKDLVGKEQLFSKKADVIGRFMNDGPFTNGLPRESPGHIGEWIGFRMVQAYLNDHPETSLPGLLEMNDTRAILKSYKPR